MGYRGYDFGGYATRFDLKCSDGRTIRHGAFKDQNGTKIPLVWNHQHDDPENVLGYGYLEHRDDGEYVYGYFNDSDRAVAVKEMLKHGDIDGLSIWANKLKETNGNVFHGVIREVSLVLAGANPGATIDTVIAHSDSTDSDDLYVYNYDESSITVGSEEFIEHSEKDNKIEEKETNNSEEGEPEMAKERTVEDVYNEMTEEQKKVVQYLVGVAADGGAEEEEDEEEVKHNVFEQDENVIAHSAIDFDAVKKDAKQLGSFKEAFLAHADNEEVDPYSPVTYGVEHLDYLFPEARELNTPPEFIKRDTDWVGKVMNSVKKSPFAKVKTTFADITADEARAKGYMRGNMKKEEFFTLIKRQTGPQTIYKKQRMDRDDVIDITSFDIIAWIKGEMRLMLDEEIARAILIGDGRLTSDDDKIFEDHIRPVSTDADLYTIKAKVSVAAGASASVIAKAFIRQAIKARETYKGSGNPVLYTTTGMLTDMLLLEDGIGRPLYDTESKLATALRVSAIVEVPVMEGATVPITTEEGGSSVTVTYPLLGIIVNLKDYNVGADKGGAIAMFDDFDIDYNQMKYLIETRCSGALIKPYSAIDLLLDQPTEQNNDSDNDIEGE